MGGQLSKEINPLCCTLALYERADRKLGAGIRQKVSAKLTPQQTNPRLGGKKFRAENTPQHQGFIAIADAPCPVHDDQDASRRPVDVI